MLRVQIAIAAPSLEGANPLRSLTLRVTSLTQSHIRLACVRPIYFEINILNFEG